MILALVTQIYADAVTLEGVWGFFGRSGVGLAAVLIPAGFFLSVAGRGATQPSRALVLIYVGAAVLTVSVGALGVALLGGA